jgi:DNA modification methylase
MGKAIEQKVTDDYAIYNGDCVELIKSIPDDSVGLSVFSPPFPSLYCYTDSTADIGNCRSIKEMLEHFSWLVSDLLRVLMPGRSCCVHLCQGVAFQYQDGYIGIKDFRGEVIKMFESKGFIYYGEVCIEKNPQVKAIRTKDRGLLFKTLAKDSALMHMALADYVIQFRKDGNNESPIHAGISEKYKTENGWITPDEWIEWASPVWRMQTKNDPKGIRETNVLGSYREGRDNEDEKHICPLQLDVIERCVKLWSAPGDVVLSPFAGIGSEGYVSIKLNRKFIGFELKPSYYKVACKNLKRALKKRESKEESLFT